MRINGPPSSAQRLPNTLSISVRGLSSAALLAALADNLAASAGAACHSTAAATKTAVHASQDGDTDGGLWTAAPSPPPPVISSVLAAMGVPVEYAVGTLRLSVGRHSTQADVDAAVWLIAGEVSAQGLL